MFTDSVLLPAVRSLLHGAIATLPLPVTADIVLNEIDPDQAGRDRSEFVELFDGGSGHTPLDGWLLVFFNGNDDTSYLALDLTGHETNAQGFFVVGNPEVPRVDLEIDPGSSGALQNGPDAVALYRASPDTFPRGSHPVPENLHDALVYGTDDPEDFALLQGLTPGHPQLDDQAEHSLSRLPDGGEPFAIDRFQLQSPTPGLPNQIQATLEWDLPAASVLESDDGSLFLLKLTREATSLDRLTVGLSSSDPSELTLPKEITIPEDMASVDLPITLPDDAWSDGDRIVVLTARAEGYHETTAELLVLDDRDDETSIVIEEVYPDDREDANQDGKRSGPESPGQDEFVEIVNRSAIALDLSGHQVWDAVALRHTFPPGTVLPAGCGCVVFGGGQVTEGWSEDFGGCLVQRANGATRYGLGLNNAADRVHLLDRSGTEIADFHYMAQGFSTASWVRDPTAPGRARAHPISDDGLGFSVGKESDGTPYCKLQRQLTATTDQAHWPENAGPGRASIQLFCEPVNDGPLTVHLASSDLSELRPPATVLVPPRAGEIVVPLEIVDDSFRDGEQAVVVTASAAGWLNATVTFQIADDGDPPAKIALNEWDSDQPGADHADFIEIFDGGFGEVPLDGYVIVLFNGADASAYAVYPLAGRMTNPAGYFVIGGPDTPNADWQPAGFSLQNGPDAIALYRAPENTYSRGFAPTTEHLVDAAVYHTADTGDLLLGLEQTLTPNRKAVNEGPDGNPWSLGPLTRDQPAGPKAGFATLDPTPGRRNVRAEAYGYPLWAASHGESLPENADPDGDGLPNLAEYALGGKPHTPDWGRLPELENGPVPGTVLLHLPLPEALPNEIRIGFEASSDLLHWEPMEPEEVQWTPGQFSAAFSDVLTSAKNTFIRMVFHTAY